MIIMIENQCISKKERTDYQSGGDMLSALPLSIIHIILALVPIRDAVKTSILSGQWRYTWTSLPWLRFEEQRLIREEHRSRIKFEDHMENFITRVLVLHKGPIYEFKLSVPFRRRCRNIDIWLLCLFRNDIRELVIDLDCFDLSWTQELHSSIYSCKKLIELELHNCTLDPPPTTFKAFLFLRCLCLRKVVMPTNEVESLVANCPLLEEFSSTDSGSSVLRISAPNLRVLDLLDDYIEMSVYAPLLAKLSVDLEDYGFRSNHIHHDSSVCNYSNFMSGFTNLEKLIGRLYFTKHLSMGIESCHDTLVFHRLKDIELDEVNFEDIKDVLVVSRLIADSPNLHKLTISKICEIDKDGASSEAPHVSFSDFGCAPNFKHDKLRVVKMSYVTGLPPEMAFIRFLLERSPVLETMGFAGLSREEEQNLNAELEGCSRASPNVKLVMISRSQYLYQ